MTQSNGWNATFELASCGGTIILQEGVNATITSPNYPRTYSSGALCEWYVQAPRGHFVEAYIDHLMLPSYVEYGNCSEYLLMRDGSDETAELIQGPICSIWAARDAGKVYRSSSRALYVKFASPIQRSTTLQSYCSDGGCGFKMRLVSSKYGEFVVWLGV